MLIAIKPNVSRYFATAVLIQTSLVLLSKGADRINVEVKINGRPSHLIFDTGASHFVLFRPAAERLGLIVSNSPALSRATGGTIPAGFTEPCKLELWNKVIETQFRVIEMPQGIRTDMEGVLGWLPLQNNVFFFESSGETVKIMGNVPAETLTWQKFSLSTNSLGLEIDLPSPNAGRMIVDTGMHGGIYLKTARWHLFGHSLQATTINALFNFHDGLVVTRESWADQIMLGPLRVNDVPVSEASPVYNAIPGFEAAIGIYGLRRIDLVVDGPNKIAYMRAAERPAPPYVYNRLGAVFVPDSLQTNSLVAHVVDGTPAQEAGIRDRDLLLTVGTLDVSNWRNNPAVMPLSRFWSAPAGTKISLTLKRGAKELETQVTLREILGPSRAQKRDNKSQRTGSKSGDEAVTFPK